MRLLDDATLALSPSDLSGHLACPHLTNLNLRCQRGELERPHVDDTHGDLIRRKGDEHEAAYLARLEAEGARSSASRPTTTRASTPTRRGGSPRRRFARARRRSSTSRTSPTAPGAGSRTSSSASRTARTRPSTRSSRARPSRRTCSSSASTPSSSGGSRAAAGALPRRARQRRARDVSHCRVHGLLPTHARAVSRSARTEPETYPWPCDHCGICDFRNLCKQQLRDDDNLVLVAGLRRGWAERLLARRGASRSRSWARSRRVAAHKPQSAATRRFHWRALPRNLQHLPLKEPQPPQAL